MLPITIKSKGIFPRQMLERYKKWLGVKYVGSRIVVPPTLAWWYWQEFGTATGYSLPDMGSLAGTRVNLAPRGPTGKYPILPTDKEKLLRFPWQGKMIYKDSVSHPGITPSRSVTKTLPDVGATLCASVHEAFLTGMADDPERLKSVLHLVAELARDNISEQLGRDLGRRDMEPDAGRLGGETAERVFYDAATIVDIGT